MRTESGLAATDRILIIMSFGMMVARDGVEPPTPAFSSTLCCSLNNLSDFRWPPNLLRSRERHANRGLKSWVQSRIGKSPRLMVTGALTSPDSPPETVRISLAYRGRD